MGNSFCANSLSKNEDGDTESCARKMISNSFRLKVVRSFWNAVVQFASDSTRSIEEMIRLGRGLWPGYAAQLLPNQVRATLEHIAERLGVSVDDVQSLEENKAKIEDELVRTLGTRFYTQLANLSKQHELATITLNEAGDIRSGCTDASQQRDFDSDSHSFLRSCLLLASFICQHNSASNDRKVFSSRGNGQRRKSDAMEDIYGGNEEDMANGTTSRLRPFVLERVFSIFVTLVHLNPTSEEDDSDFLMDSLGSTRLQADLAHLIDIGFLHQSKYNGLLSGEQMNLGTARFTCSLTHEEAIALANRHGIPLEQYLL